MCRKFRAQILTFELNVPLLQGSQVVLHTQAINVPASITRLRAIIDKTGKQGAKPRWMAFLSLSLSLSVCVCVCIPWCMTGSGVEAEAELVCLYVHGGGDDDDVQGHSSEHSRRR